MNTILLKNINFIKEENKKEIKIFNIHTCQALKEIATPIGRLKETYGNLIALNKRTPEQEQNGTQDCAV